jgi:hypothetical protein
VIQMSENSIIMMFFVHGGYYAQLNFLQSTG